MEKKKLVKLEVKDLARVAVGVQVKSGIRAGRKRPGRA